MRIEIMIGDERDEAQILGGVADPSAYLVELVRADRGTTTQRTEDSLPDYARIFAEAQNCRSAFKTPEDVDRYIDSLRSEW
jgi:hypothetical protein